MLQNEVVRKHLDFTEPIALYQCGTLHHYSGDRYAEIMQEYVDALPSGSYVALSHFYDPETPDYSPLARKMEEVFLHSPMGSGLVPHPRADPEHVPRARARRSGSGAGAPTGGRTGRSVKPMPSVSYCIVGRGRTQALTRAFHRPGNHPSTGRK